jgi:phosphoribosylformylglycinamidine cyclo-ligase
MAKRPMTYAAAGVDIHAGDKMVDMIEHQVRRTYGPRVLASHGGFAGMLRLDYNERLFNRNYKDPVLVSCTDGVGTKVKLAAELKIYNTVGIDLVAMSVNDLIVQGAEPLIFLDYLAVNKLDPQIATQMVEGVATGCVQAGAALLGGETAEMPDVYAPGEFDMAGFAVGVCELKRVVNGQRAEAGDIIIGLASSGIHSNGYSLVRAIVKQARLDLHGIYPELDPTQTLGQVLLTPTKIYAKAIVSLLRSYKRKQPVTAMSHITGSGLPGNVPRTLGTSLNAKLDLKSWDRPPVFDFLQKHGSVADQEMFDVFNMGLGYVVIVKPFFADAIVHHLQKQGEDARIVGRLVKGTGNVTLS